MDSLNFKKISHEKANVLKTAGLHKVAAILEKVATGRDIKEVNLPVAITLLGEKAFIKNAEQKRIFAGIEAYKQLKG